MAEEITQPDDAPKKRGRPKKDMPQDEATARVIVMHPTNITLSVGKVPFRGQAEISEGEFNAICSGDEAAGRQPRLVRIDGK